jgi:hypothetical protein
MRTPDIVVPKNGGLQRTLLQRKQKRKKKVEQVYVLAIVNTLQGAHILQIGTL